MKTPFPAAFADLTEFQSLLPKHRIAQSDSLTWLQKYTDRIAEAAGKPASTLTQNRFHLYGVKPEMISARYFENPDLGNPDFEANTLYPLPTAAQANPETSPLFGASIGKRGKFFIDRTKQILENFYPVNATSHPEATAITSGDAADKAPSQLIHVTCTGYVSPSAAQALVSNRRWNTGVTHAYHMGCYAALPAIRMAQGFVAAQTAQAGAGEQNPRPVDIVHTEMCSLHLNPTSDSVEQTIVQTLFADGNIKYSVLPAGTAKSGLRLYGIKETLIPDTTDQMSWAPEFWGFQMTLGKKVPILIKKNIRNFVLDLYKEAGWEFGADFSKTIFAVHPGGPKIIDVVQETLELENSQVASSREILFERGNMSSATLPHVWERILEKKPKPGTPIVSLAFGPGLTVFGALFKVI